MIFSNLFENKVERHHQVNIDINGKIFTSTPTDDYWEPPTDFDVLTMYVRAQSHHESALDCKTKTIAIGYTFADSSTHDQESLEGMLPYFDLEAAVLDYNIYGNCYFELIRNRLGEIVELKHLHARTMRVGIREGQFFQVIDGEKKRKFDGNILHIRNYAPESSLYGLPKYLGTRESIALNNLSKRMRNAFLNNGSFVQYFVLANLPFDDRDEHGESPTENKLKQKLEETKLDGSGKPIFLNFDGEVDGDLKEKFNVIEFNADSLFKDDFHKTTEVTRNDILSAHQVAPEILSVFTDNRYSGDLEKIVKMYNMVTVRPIQIRFKTEINKILPPTKHINFIPFSLDPAPNSQLI